MYLPKRVKIRGKWWKVVLQKNPKDDDGKPCYGHCDTHSYILTIDSELDADDMLETFIHEYIHACNHEAGIADEKFPSWMEHLIINSVSKDMRNNASLWLKVFSSYLE